MNVLNSYDLYLFIYAKTLGNCLIERAISGVMIARVVSLLLSQIYDARNNVLPRSPEILAEAIAARS